MRQSLFCEQPAEFIQSMQREAFSTYLYLQREYNIFLGVSFSNYFSPSYSVLNMFVYNARRKSP
jgi:hypothetical protein